MLASSMVRRPLLLAKSSPARESGGGERVRGRGGIGGEVSAGRGGEERGGEGARVTGVREVGVTGQAARKGDGKEAILCCTPLVLLCRRPAEGEGGEGKRCMWEVGVTSHTTRKGNGNEALRSFLTRYLYTLFVSSILVLSLGVKVTFHRTQQQQSTQNAHVVVPV